MNLMDDASQRTLSLAGQAWLHDADTRKVVEALMKGGHNARFVGGCVRDALLRLPVRDIDIATPERPKAVMALLRSAGIKALPTGLQHGTITAVTDSHHYEITTLRVDVETDGRRATVEFTEDWETDAERRDFTINALYADIDGTVHDYVGGLEDLKSGHVRFIGDPYKRIEEDALRILRFFRFHAWYGKGDLDEAGLTACWNQARRIKELSGERLANELLLLLGAPNPGKVLKTMVDVGILRDVLSEAVQEGVVRVERLSQLEAALQAVDPLRRLAAVVDTDSPGMDELTRRLRMSNADRKRLVEMIRPGPDVVPTSDERTLRKLLYQLGRDRFVDLLFLGAARREDPPDVEAIRKTVDFARAWIRPNLPVKGADVVAIGIPQGEGVRKVLAAVENWWIEEDFPSDREKALEQIKTAAAALKH
jgi:poly(A) polymerase